MRDCAPWIDINHPRCGLSKFLEEKWRTKKGKDTNYYRSVDIVNVSRLQQLL